MKNLTIKIIIPSLLLIVAAFIIGPACTEGPVSSANSQCDQSTSPFKTLWTNLLATNSDFIETNEITSTIHEYSFTLETNKKVCSIGYQGNASLYDSNIPYLIEILNNTNQTIVYSENILFKPTVTDYHSLSNTIELIEGESYTIRRTAGNLNDTSSKGRVLFTDNDTSLPFSSEGMTITSANFYESGSPTPETNNGVPYIDIIFQTQ